MRKVKLTVIESNCRCNILKKGDIFIVQDTCPPICHEFWNAMYPYVYALLNGADLDYGNARSKQFDIACPDGARVMIHGEVIDE